MDEHSTQFPLLNLPEVELRLRSLGESTQIYDAFRKRWLVLTPEEWVRQHFLHFLINELHYPKNRIAIEFSILLNGMRKRADVLVFGAKMQPWMLIECKHAGISLSQAVFDQAARYNLKLQVPFLVITNGMDLMAAEITENRIEFLKELPPSDCD